MRRKRNVLLWVITWIYLFLVCVTAAFIAPQLAVLAATVLLCAFLLIGVLKPKWLGLKRQDEESEFCEDAVFPLILRLNCRFGDRIEPVTVDRQDYLIGRTPDCALKIPGGASLGVSRRHALIRYVSSERDIGAYCIIPLKSPNGVKLNGKMLETDRPTLIRDRDVIALGNFVMRAVIESR